MSEASISFWVPSLTSQWTCVFLYLIVWSYLVTLCHLRDMPRRRKAFTVSSSASAAHLDDAFASLKLPPSNPPHSGGNHAAICFAFRSFFFTLLWLLLSIDSDILWLDFVCFCRPFLSFCCGWVCLCLFSPPHVFCFAVPLLWSTSGQ